MRRPLWIISLALAAFWVWTMAAWAESPTAYVQAILSNVMRLQNDASLSNQTRARDIHAIIEKSFDFDMMAKSSLSSTFKTLSKAQQQEFNRTFSYRVIGVMESKGQVLGFDMDDTVFIPVARGLELFNRPGVMEIDVTYPDSADPDKVEQDIRRIMTARHGREDYTVISQEKAMEVLGSVLDVVTFAVGALGGISLLVGGVGILTIMTMAVTERTTEIGLLRALGAKERQVLTLFLGEAILLSAFGGLAGLVLGAGVAQALHWLFPALPVHTPWMFAVLAELSAVCIGLAAGVIPARHAARLDPVEALHAE